jgi:hypothetical protein
MKVSHILGFCSKAFKELGLRRGILFYFLEKTLVRCVRDIEFWVIFFFGHWNLNKITQFNFCLGENWILNLGWIKVCLIFSFSNFMNWADNTSQENTSCDSQVNEPNGACDVHVLRKEGGSLTSHFVRMHTTHKWSSEYAFAKFIASYSFKEK